MLASETARMPPKCFATDVGLQHDAVRHGRAQEFRQRQPFVDLAPAHGRALLGRRPPSPAQLAPDAGQAGRGEQDEADEDQPEPQQPVVGPDREELAEQDVEQDAQHRALEAPHAADHDHREELARERDGRRFGRREAMIEHQQRTGQSGDDGRQHERPELVPVGVVALEHRALLVLADRHQHVPERRAHDAQQRVRHREPDQRDQRVVGRRRCRGRPARACRARCRPGRLRRR